MKNVIRALIASALFLLICPALVLADIVYIKNGDKLFGTIKNAYFSLRTPYGKVIVKNEFLKSINSEEGPMGRWIIETINNDRFSGSLLNDGIQFIQEDGTQKMLGKDRIQRVKREVSGPSYAIRTTIITMKNNDRFSGKFLNTGLEIRANHTTESIHPGEINRIEFSEDDLKGTTILLENGDLLTGTLNQNQIRLAPDALPEFKVSKSSLKSIQFNAPKMVLKKIGNAGQSEKDGDGDGVPDFADMCPDTPYGVAVSLDGCRKETPIAKVDKKAGRSSAVNHNNAIQKHLDGNFEKILFDFNKFELKPQFYSVLDEISLVLTQNPKMKIEIRGHTDKIGTEDYNQRLSEKRAQMAKNYLVSKGIEQDRLFTVGFGFKMNITSNESEAGRALNRRVEFSLKN